MKFVDGISWLLKVLVNGTPDKFYEAGAESLRSEALLMRLLRRGTTIPVEEMFSFSTDCDNELGWPFILMEFIEGRSLEDIWFDRVSSREVV